MQQFPDKLRILREQRDMTQRDLARELGVTQGYVYFLENGHRKPNVDLLLKLSRLFGVTLDELAKDEIDLDSDQQ